MKLVTVAQLAELMGISRNSVYELVRRKAIPHIRIGGRQVRFSLEAVRLHYRIPDTVQSAPREASHESTMATPLRTWFRAMPDEVRQSLIMVLHWILTEADPSLDPANKWRTASHSQAQHSAEPLIESTSLPKPEYLGQPHTPRNQQRRPLPPRLRKVEPKPAPVRIPKKFGLAEAAAKLGVSKGKLRQLVRDGVLFVPVIGTRHYYVETWIDEYIRLGQAPSYGWQAHVYRWGWNRETPERRREEISVLGVDHLAESMKLDPTLLSPEKPVPIA